MKQRIHKPRYPRSSISHPRPRASGFSLIELMVVIGMVALLLSMLMPALGSARRQGECVKCKAQLREIFHLLTMYTNENAGWLYPVGEFVDDPSDRYYANTYRTLGTNKHPAYRWPMYVFQFSHPPVPSPEPPERQNWTYEDIRPFNPPVMACPGDPETPYGHSYVLNMHLIENKEKLIKAGTRLPGGRATSEVVYMGEKRTDQGDYYMQVNEFDRVVEPYRHGLRLGSNYLYLDGHVSLDPPEPVKAELDPWDIPAAAPATQPI